MDEDIILDIIPTSPTIITDASCSNIESTVIVRKKRATNTIKPPKNTKLTYDEYNKNTTDLTKYKIPELKALAKLYKLHITGNKTTLIRRIQNYFQFSISVIVIQKNLRRFFVKRSFQLRGPAKHDRGICTNPTDFYTLEPLDEIPHQEFFSYTEIGANGQYTYGFNIQSLMQLLRRKGRAIVNPYNREKIPEKAIGDFIRLYLYTIILFPEHVSEEERYTNSRNPFLQPVNVFAIAHGAYYGFPRRISTGSSLHTPLQSIITRRTNDLESVQVSTIFEASQNIPLNSSMNHPIRALRNYVIPRTHSLVPVPVHALEPSQMTYEPPASALRHFGVGGFQPPVHMPHTLTEGPSSGMQGRRPEGVQRNMEEIRSKPIETRIQELFMEIDQLGNYTQVSWFTNLTRRELYNYYHRLHHIWRHRSRMPFSVRQRICPLGDPFPNTNILSMGYDQISADQLIGEVVSTMENLCYTAMDIEDRKLGAIYTLIALTHVSLPARENLIWLYESM